MARPKKPVRLDILEQAMEDVQDREGLYGNPLINHHRIAVLMEAWERAKMSSESGGTSRPVDSIVFQILTNLARLVETPDNQAAWENIAGYAAIGYEVSSEQ